MSSSPKQCSLETIDFNKEQERLQSPNSKLALKQLGLDEKELYFQSKEDYIINHPDLKLASPSIQDTQYAKHETRRLNLIQKAKDLRNDIINKSTSNSSKDLYNSSKELTSFLMHKELDKIDQMRLHQIGEIKSIIDYEVYIQELKKRNEYRMQHLKEKEEALRLKQQRELEEREMKCVLEEKERQKHILKEEREAYKKIMKQEEEERKRREEEEKRREAIEREALSKLLERRKLQGESQKRIEEMELKNKNEQEKRLKELELKEEFRINYIEQKKQEAMVKLIKNEKHAIETYNIALQKNEEDKNIKQHRIEMKLNTTRECIKKYNEDLEKKNKEQMEKNIIKEKQIQENTKKFEEQIQKRSEDYEIQKENQNKSIELIRKSNWELFQKLRKHNPRNDDWRERKQKNDSLFEIKKAQITLRQSQSEEKVQIHKEKEKQITYDKIIQLRMKRETNSDNYHHYEKIIQFHNMEKMQRYQMKLKKIRETEIERKEITDKKKNLEDALIKRKELMLNRINRIVNSNNYNSQNDVYQKVLTKEQYSFTQRRNNSTSNNCSHITSSTSRYGTRTRFASPNISAFDSSVIKEQKKEANDVNKSNYTIKFENSNSISNVSFNIIQSPHVKRFNNNNNANLNNNSNTLEKIIDQ